jgi:ankyrin repeat protein
MEYVESALESGALRGTRVMDSNGNTLLHICAQNNLRKMAALVLSHGCDINALNHKSCSALDYAERYSFTKMADWLRSKGALNAESLQ